MLAWAMHPRSVARDHSRDNHGPGIAVARTGAAQGPMQSRSQPHHIQGSYKPGARLENETPPRDLWLGRIHCQPDCAPERALRTVFATVSRERAITISYAECPSFHWRPAKSHALGPLIGPAFRHSHESALLSGIKFPDRLAPFGRRPGAGRDPVLYARGAHKTENSDVLRTTCSLDPGLRRDDGKNQRSPSCGNLPRNRRRRRRGFAARDRLPRQLTRSAFCRAHAIRVPFDGGTRLFIPAVPATAATLVRRGPAACASTRRAGAAIPG